MNVVLWILQGILALMFLGAGVMKSTQPKEKLLEKMPWADDFSPNTLRLIGISELIGALGLILPALTGIAPILTPIAATALALIMVLAIAVHARRKEYSAVAINVVLVIAFAIVAWGRFGPYSL